MENQVRFRDRQELKADDLNNVQSFARAALDHVVVDTIENGKAYSGFLASKTAATQITVDPGRLYAAGSVYAREDTVVVDLFNNLPLVTRKRVAIVAWGQDVDQDVQPRDFLIDAQTGQTEPQSVPMESTRYCNISPVAGVEGPDPTYPTTDANVVVIAYALLDTSGILSIEQVAANRVMNLRTVGNTATELTNWRSQISSRIDTLANDILTISARLSTFATQSQIQAILLEIAALKAKLDSLQPAKPAYLCYNVNHFFDLTDANTAASGFDCSIDRGLRFPATATATITLTLLNPISPLVVFYGAWMLPVHIHFPRIICRGYHREHRCGSVTFFTRAWVKLTIAVARIVLHKDEHGPPCIMPRPHLTLTTTAWPTLFNALRGPRF